MGQPPRLSIRSTDALGAGVSGYVRAAAASPGDVDSLLARLPELSSDVPMPASGRTLDRFAALASVASADVTAARVLEPHLDALAILCEAGELRDGDTAKTWGVFAAEGPAGRLNAQWEGDSWLLTGYKPWCSLGGRLDAALVTAYTGDRTRRLFRVGLRSPGVRVEDVPWVARGLSHLPSGPLLFDHVRAEPVGEDGWYLVRPGFAWGGIGVAACWWGASVALSRAIIEAALARSEDALVMGRVGRMVRLIAAARLSLENAAAAIDAGSVSAESRSAIAHAVRGTVIAATDDVLEAVRDVLGPAALAFDERIATVHADLGMYTAQYHHLRDDASLGRAAVSGAIEW